MAGIPKKRETLNRLHSDDKFIESIKNGCLKFFEYDRWVEIYIVIEQYKKQPLDMPKSIIKSLETSIYHGIFSEMYKYIIDFEYVYIDNSISGRFLILPGRLKLMREDGTLPQLIYDRFKLIVEHAPDGTFPDFISNVELINIIEEKAEYYQNKCMNDYTIDKTIENEKEYKELGYIK